MVENHKMPTMTAHRIAATHPTNQRIRVFSERDLIWCDGCHGAIGACDEEVLSSRLVCAMVSSTLSANGERPGLYTGKVRSSFNWDACIIASGNPRRA